MIYILQKNLPANKLALLAIQEIFGIGTETDRRLEQDRQAGG